MLAPFATLVFLATLWLAGLVIAEMLGQSGGKVIAALKGRSAFAEPGIYSNVVKISQRSQARRTLRAQPQFSDLRRAAA